MAADATQSTIEPGKKFTAEGFLPADAKKWLLVQWVVGSILVSGAIFAAIKPLLGLPSIDFFLWQPPWVFIIAAFAFCLGVWMLWKARRGEILYYEVI